MLATAVPGHSRLELASGVDAAATTFAVDQDVVLPEDLKPGRYRVLMGSDAVGWYRSDIIVIESGPGT